MKVASQSEGNFFYKEEQKHNSEESKSNVKEQKINTWDVNTDQTLFQVSTEWMAWM